MGVTIPRNTDISVWRDRQDVDNFRDIVVISRNSKFSPLGLGEL